MKFLILVLLSLIFFSGCSSRATPYLKRKEILKPNTNFAQTKNPSYKLKNKNAITKALYSEYKKWRASPYCYGGDSKEGIDCSSLVQHIYYDAFALRVPRTTKEQAKIGYKVSRNETREGDLLLFKTGYSTRHSGIYLESGNFINTSTKHGVTISNLNNPYWRSKYSQARRVLLFK
ncbi:MAG: NlpC/P60 family protein [Sulfurimonas sp.]